MKVKVNYLTYEIKEVSQIETTGNLVLNGECDHEHLIIYLKKEVIAERKRQILCHELLHAITDNLELHLTEEEIEMTSIGLMMFVKDNIPFIKKMIAEMGSEAVDKKAKK
jgi:hypothetical protein